MQKDTTLVISWEICLNDELALRYDPGALLWFALCAYSDLSLICFEDSFFTCSCP